MAPRFPSIKNKGVNATIVVKTPKVTGVATSWVPSMAAVRESLPMRMCR